METEQKYHSKERTEHVQHIIDRMPVKFGFWISVIVGVIFIILFVFGWIIRYPDVVSGKIMINTSVAPIKLVSNISGKLQLRGFKSSDIVREESIIAYIQNPTSIESLLAIIRLLDQFDPNEVENTGILDKLPPKVALGELSQKYYAFISCVQQTQNFKQNKLYEKQISSLQQLATEQKAAIVATEKKLRISEENLKLGSKFYGRDSILFVRKVLSESDFDKTQMNFLSSRDNYQSTLSAVIGSREQAQQTLSKIQEVEIQKNEKEKELALALSTTYNDLKDNINLWQQKYLFKAPFNGKVQFLKFWTNSHFVQAGEPVFTIIPDQQEPYGQLILPAIGAGKVKMGQEVIVKLDDFPYMEYGTIKGKVSAISLTTNTEKTEQGNLETYLVTVKFSEGLRTNYGRKLEFKSESKGSADIITNDRRLIQRLFDNIKYVLNK
ncbi:HlyD family efflux transporter periplasmic adaptor subunit [Pedobacter frigoris]|uniref:HlyD family efflux transporter periplasmic adaptor subunit n=1 Tax=Pedobacter frigoris TaxID=2571272 RepID=UPI00292F95A3|nr:HlyD family efflux transporter periplasmic adaptor subunit [Pedobacter frigoris]